MKIFIPIVLLFALAACEQQGPAERAGEELDEAVQSLQRDAEDMQEQVDDAVDEARNEASDMARDAEQAVEELKDEVDPDTQ